MNIASHTRKWQMIHKIEIYDLRRFGQMKSFFLVMKIREMIDSGLHNGKKSLWKILWGVIEPKKKKKVL